MSRLHRKVAAETRTVSGMECAPIDRMAARVTSPGIAYNPNKRLHKELWDAPPPTYPPPKEIENLIGTRRGRVEIVGYLGRRRLSKAKGNQHNWLMRCGCGKYESRDGYAWRRGLKAGQPDLCQHCGHLAHVKRHDHWARTGEEVDFRT